MNARKSCGVACYRVCVCYTSPDKELHENPLLSIKMGSMSLVYIGWTFGLKATRFTVYFVLLMHKSMIYDLRKDILCDEIISLLDKYGKNGFTKL